MMELEIEKQQLAESLIEEKQIAEQSVIDKNRFLAAASHDLRQPLHSAGLYMSALEPAIKGEDSKRLFNGIEASIGALKASFNSLLDVSKLDAGVVEVNSEHFSLNELIEEVLSQLRRNALEKNLDFQLQAKGVHYVFTDPLLLSRVLQNLVSNALNYTEAGSVTLRIENKNDQSVFLTIADTGIGIPLEEQENIFSEYYQLHNPERDRSKGFGLGLAIVKRLSDLMKIDLQFESEVNKGTTFELNLPKGINKKEDKAEADSGASTTDQSKKTVLVIDDDSEVLLSMSEFLSRSGFQVYCAEDELQAISLMSDVDQMPAIIVADYRLKNDKTGVQACNRISEEFNQNIPALIVTGDTSPDRINEALDSGYEVLHKPVEPPLLRLTISKLIAVEVN